MQRFFLRAIISHLTNKIGEIIKKTKKLLSVMLSVLMLMICLSPLTALAASEKKATVSGVKYTYTVNKGKATITGIEFNNYKKKPYTFPSKLEGKGKFTAKIAKQKTQTTGYEIQYSTSKKFKGAKKVTLKNSATSKTVKKLKRNKKYYVRVRTYKKSGKTTCYSSWSKTKTIKIK